MLLSILLLGLLASVSSAVTPSWLCNSTFTLNIKNDGNMYSYPFATNTPQQYTSPQSCAWKFTVPKGQYALVRTHMKLNLRDSILIETNNNYRHNYPGRIGGDIPRTGDSTFYVPAGNAVINFATFGGLQNGSLALSIQIMSLPNGPASPVTALTPQVISLSQVSMVQMLFSAPAMGYTLRTITAECNKVDYRYDTCHVYSGQSIATGTFVSGLSNYIDSIPTGFNGSAVVYCFSKDVPTGSMLLYHRMPTIDLKSSWEVATGCGYLFGDGTAHPAYLTTYCYNDCTQYLERATNSQGKNVAIGMFNGVLGTDMAILGTAWTTGRYLPQQINGGHWKTFAIQGGDASLTLDQNSTKWQTASVRKGFFATPNYGFQAIYQTTSTNIKSSTKYKYIVTLSSIAAGSLQVDIDQGSGQTYTTIFYPNATNKQTSGSAVGYGMRISYVNGPGQNNMGALMNFEIQSVSGASLSGVLLLIISICQLML